MNEEREKLIAIIEQAQRDANDTIGSMNGGSAAWYADKLIEAGVVLRKETPKSPNYKTIIANVDEMLAEYLRKRLKIVLDSIDVAPVVHGKWIPVTERLPEVDEFVLILVSGEYKNIEFRNAIQIGDIDDEGWWIEAHPEWRNPKVTHWMPLPEGPKEEHDA